MGLFTAAQLAAADVADPVVFPLMEIDYPSGTVGYSGGGVKAAAASPSGFAGYYQAKVPTWGGEIVLSAPDRQMALVGSDATPVVIDTDYQFADMCGLGYRLVGSAARIYLYFPNLTGSDRWFTVFSGVLYDFDFQGDAVVQLRLRPPDLKLNNVFPRKVADIIDWANLPKESAGECYPLIYGAHDTFATKWSGGPHGALVCLYVDSDASTNEYLVALGWVNVLRVYADSVLKTSGYTVNHKTKNGRYITTITFTVSQAGTAITVDVEGYESVGDGTGLMIRTPADQLAHIASNFFSTEYQRGAWAASDSAIIDTASFTALNTALAARACGTAYAGSHKVSKQETARQVIEAWAASHQVCVYWTNAGKLAVKLDENNMQGGSGTTYLDAALIRESDLLAPPRYSYDTQDVIGRFLVHYNTVENSGSGQDTSHVVAKPNDQIEVYDPLSTTSAPSGDSLDSPWGPATTP